MTAFSNVATERGILAAIWKFNREAYLEVSDLINSQTFTTDLNRDLYTVFCHLFEKNIDVKIDMHLILGAIADLHLTKTFDNEVGYLNAVANFHVELSNVRGFAKKIRRLSEAKAFRQIVTETGRDLEGVTGDESMSQILALGESKILEYSNQLSANSNEGIIHVTDGLLEYLENNKNNPREMVGISTGFGRLDKAMGGGLRRKTVNIIAARPGIGKTLLADTIGLHVACKLGMPVLELDTEMDIEGHWPRILAAMTHVPIEEIENGSFGKDVIKSRKIDTAYKRLKESKFSYQNVSGKEFEEVLSIARRWVMQHVGYNSGGATNDCLFIFDYLKMMNSDALKNGNVREYQELGFMINDLHAFTVQYSLPCLSFVQVNRDGITKETSDIVADSDRILRLASSIFLYKEKDPEEIAEDGPDNGNRKMVYIKARYGGGLDPNDFINCHHTKNIAKIVEVNTRNELRRGNTGTSGTAKPVKPGTIVTNSSESVEF